MTKLEKFLREKGAYEAFVQNLYDGKCFGSMAMDEYDNLNECMDNVPIDDAFLWRDTPERHDYWSRLNDKFSKLD